jgi:ferric-dicitrate binding protein FerR (iron transport regulator)
MSCEKYIKLIEKYLSADIKNAELNELNGHIQQCASCRSKFEQIDRFEGIIKSAFSSATTAKQASESVLSKLPASRPVPTRTLPFSARMAVAASVILGAGFILGFVFAGFDSVERIKMLTAAKVPMKVTRLEGTVLVKHQDSELWHPLEESSNIYLGDTFHSMSKSGFILEMENKSTLELNQNSMLALKLYNGGTQFHLEHGELAAALESPHGPFFISTPHGRVEALGTEFTVSVE